MVLGVLDMGRKISKHLTLAVSLVCLWVVMILSIASPVLAQDQIHVYGEIAGGYAHSYPVELKVGEVISGQIIVRNNTMTLSLADSTGKVIYDFGSCSTSCDFHYAAEVSGKHNLIVGNPDTYAIGTRGYNIYYSIRPTTLAPGMGSGTKVTGDATKPSATSGSMTAVWWIVGTFAFVFILVSLFVGSRRRRRVVIIEDDFDDDEIIIERRDNRPAEKPSSSDRIRDLYFPKPLRDIHQKGLKDLRQRQEEDLKRTLKRLRRQ